MTVAKLLEQLGNEAERLRAEEPCLDEDIAVIRALLAITTRAKKPPEAHEERILDALRRLGKGGKQPVSSLQLALELNIPHSTMQLYLRELENRFHVTRPWGAKGGYAIAS